MQNLHLKPKILILILFFLSLLPSCNNEEMFIDESYVLEQEKEDEDTDGNEDIDEILPIDVNDYSNKTTQNIPVDLFLYSNDLNVPSAITFTGSNPDNGTIVLKDNNTPENFSDDFITYTPNPRFSGIDTFEYTLCDATNLENCDSALVTITIEPMDFAPVLKAFPNAYGGGGETIGGRGKVLCIVNTLDFNTPLTYHRPDGLDDEYYSGGLKEALTNKNVGHIVFNVSGNIQLPSGGIDYTIDHKSIHGQSAPRGGITIWGGRIKLTAAKDIIFRYFRSRPILSRGGLTPAVAFNTVFSTGKSAGDDSYTWALRLEGGERIIVDHFSASFSYDKNLGGAIATSDQTMGAWTISNCLGADAATNLYAAINAGRDQTPLPAVQNRPYNISFLNNVMTGANRSPQMSYGGFGEIINNIVHDVPYKYTSTSWNMKLNHIGNYYSGERISPSFARNRILSTSLKDEPESKPEIYTNGNYLVKSDNSVVLDGNPTNNDRVLWTNYIDGWSSDGWASPVKYGGQPQFFTNIEHTSTIIHKYNPTTASEAFTKLIIHGDVGASKYLDDQGNVQIYRDSFDTSQLKYVANNDDSYEPKKASNWVLPAIPNNTRPDNYDMDHDGMADEWERKRYGNLDQSYRGDFNGDGYDNLETFLNQVDE